MFMATVSEHTGFAFLRSAYYGVIATLNLSYTFSAPPCVIILLPLLMHRTTVQVIFERFSP